MQERQLFLNGQSVDLSETTKIGVTLQANNIAELQKRQSDFTNIFKIPINAKNRTIVESAENLNSVTSIPYEILTAQYFENGNPTIEEGTAVLVNSDADFYYFKVNSGNKEFFGLFPDIKIKDLTIPGTTHERNFLTILNSRSNDSGFIYPLINWFESNSTAFNDPEVDTEFLFPALFVKDIFDAVDLLTGYKSKGSFIDSNIFPNLLITPKDFRRPSSVVEKYNSETKVINDQTVLCGVNNGTTTSVNYLPFMQVQNGDFVSQTYTSPANIFGYLKFSGQINLSYQRFEFQSRIVRLKIQIVSLPSNTVIEESVLYDQLSVLDPSESILSLDFNFNVITSNLLLNTGDQYACRVRIEDTLKGQFTLKTESKFQFKLINSLPYGTEVNTSEIFDLKLIEMYRDVMNIYGITPQTDAFRKEVYFDFFEDISSTKQNAEDWSSKIDVVQKDLSYKFGNYAQKNYFRFAAEETVPEFLNDVSFTISDSTLPDESTIVQLNASTVEFELKFQGEEIARIKSVNSAGEFNATNFRFLLLDRRATDYEIEYFDDTNSDLIDTDIPFTSPVLFDLETYYLTLQEILNRAKVLRLKVRLSEIDVQNIRRRSDIYQDRKGFLQSVYLNVQSEKIQANGYFYINKVENFQGGFARVEFVRL